MDDYRSRIQVRIPCGEHMRVVETLGGEGEVGAKQTRQAGTVGPHPLPSYCNVAVTTHEMLLEFVFVHEAAFTLTGLQCYDG